MSIRLLLAVALVSLAYGAQAQGSCGAAGGAPAGTSFDVCGYLNEALGLPAPGAPAGAGNPVDLVTGNKYRRELDLQIPGRQPFVFARHYNSRNRFSGPMGVGWSHSFETRIARVKAGSRDTVQIVQGDGRRLVFERDRHGAWRTDEPAEGTLDMLASGGKGIHWRWRQPGGVTVVFDPDGRTVRVERDGDPTITFRRGRDGALLTASHDGLTVLSLEYRDHPHGKRLVEATGNAGRIRWTYGDTGQLVSTHWADGTSHHYRYDDPNDPMLMTSVSRFEGLIGRPGVEIARYEYDPQGRTIHTWSAGGEALRIGWALPLASGDRGETTVIGERGETARYGWHYDPFRHRSRIVDTAGEACSSCPPAPRRYHYDPVGRLVGVDTPADAWRLERDDRGRPIAATRHERGRAEPERLWRAGYSAPDANAGWSWLEQPSIAPGRVHRIEIERDRWGRVTTVAEHGWSPRHDATDVRAWRSISRRFGLAHPSPGSGAAPPWSARTLVPIRWVDGPEPGSADRLDVRDGQHPGQVVLDRSERLSERLEFRNGELQGHLTPTGIGVGFSRSADAGSTVWRATATTDRSSATFRFDERGKLASLTRRDGTADRTIGADALGQGHRAAQSVLATWRGRATRIALSDGSVFERGFDDFGRVVWIDEPGAPRQWAGYDSTDRLLEHRPGDGSVLVYRRDTAGRLREAVVQHDGSTTLLGRYTWDGARLVEATNETVTIRYTYDADGRLSGVRHEFPHLQGRSLRWEWSRVDGDRIAEEWLPGGHRVRYEWSGDRVVSVHVRERAVDVETLLRPREVTLDVATLTRPLELHPANGRIERAASPRFVGGTMTEAAGFTHVRDPHGRRAAKHAVDAAGGRLSRLFVHHDWRLRAEIGDGDRVVQWLWANDRPVGLLVGDDLYRIVTDSRRAPVRAVDANGRVVWEAAYDRWGSANVSRAARIDVPLRLPGQYLDAESGLHYNHRRTYDPATGRYLERDPLGLQSDWVDREDLWRYAGGDPIGHSDPWGLARLRFFALTSNAQGAPMGRSQGFDLARWSFMIEDIAPVPLIGDGSRPPEPAGIGTVLFDPWGDFVSGRNAPRLEGGNGVDAIAATGTDGREVFAAFAAHYGARLATTDRFVVEAFDDRRAGALARILSAPPADRAGCIHRALDRLPAFSPSPMGRSISVNESSTGINRLIACAGPPSLPLTYNDDTERWRVETLQAAAELQESPTRALADPCREPRGCPAQGRVIVNGRTYLASWGRTQFTVTTFLSELMRIALRGTDAEATALRNAIGLDRSIVLDGRTASVGDALVLARRRVDAAYRSFAALRDEFGRGVDADRAGAIWQELPETRRARFTAETGLGRREFVDMLGYVATGRGGLTEEEGRHALAAAAADTVAWTTQAGPGSFRGWMVDLFASADPYDHLSRAFLRDNLRRVLAAPSLSGRFDNSQAAGTPAWEARQQDIERDIAQRVAVLHNAGSLALATRPDLSTWLEANPDAGISVYVSQFTSGRGAGNWNALRCAPGLAAGRALQMASLAQTFTPPPPPAPTRGGTRRR